jgi:thioesterase domain-containing protein
VFESMSSQKFEKYARRCSELARQADTPERSERLLRMAQEYMQAARDLETSEAPPQPCLESSSIGKTAFTYEISNALDDGWHWSVTCGGRILAQGRAPTRAQARADAIVTAVSYDERTLS